MIGIEPEMTTRADEWQWDRFLKTRETVCFETIVAAHRDRVFDVALRILRDRQLAEDVAQDVFLGLYVSPKTPPQDVPWRAWVLRIVRNSALQKLRAMGRRARREGKYAMHTEARAVDDGHETEKRETLLRVKEALKRLPEEFQLPLALHYLHGLSYAEVGAVLDAPVGSVSSRIARALERLRASPDLRVSGTGAAALPALLERMPLEAAPGAIGNVAELQAVAAQAGGHGVAAKGAAGAAKASAASLAAKLAVIALVVSGVAVVPSLPIGRPAAGGQSVAGRVGLETPAPVAGEKRPAPAADPLDTVIGVDFNRTLVNQVLSLIQRESGMPHVYPRALEGRKSFTLKKEKATVREVLDRLARSCGLVIEIRDGTVLAHEKSSRLLPLGRKLKEGNVQERCEAVWDLGQLGDLRAFEKVIEALDDPDPAVVTWAVRALEHTAPEEGRLYPGYRGILRYVRNVNRMVETFVRWLPRPPAGAHRVVLVKLLSICGNPDAAKALLALQEDAHPGIQQAAMKALRRTLSPQAIDVFRNALSEPKRRDLREIVMALGEMRDERVPSILLEVIDDPNVQTWVRQAAASCLGKYDTREVRGAVLTRLKSECIETRTAALHALSRLEPDRAVKEILALFEKAKDPAEHEMLLGCLGACRVPAAGPALSRFARARSPKTRFRAVRYLTARPDGFEVIRGLLDDQDKDVREAAAKALLRCPPEKALTLVLEKFVDNAGESKPDSQPLGLRAQNLETLRHAQHCHGLARFLASSEDARAQAALLRMLESAGHAARRYFIAALDPSRNAKIRRRVLAGLHDPSPDVRRAAVTALGRCSDSKTGQALWDLLKTERDRNVLFDLCQRLLGRKDMHFSEVLDRIIRKMPGFRIDWLVRHGGNRQHHDALIRRLVPMLERGGRDTRASAAAAFVHMPNPRLVRPLQIALLDDDDVVREQAGKALGTSGDPRSVGPLLELLKEEPVAVGNSVAVHALYATRDPRVYEILGHAIAIARKRATRTDAARVLAISGDPRALPILERLAAHEDPKVRTAIVSCLPLAGPSGLDDRMRAFLKDPDQEVRTAAARWWNRRLDRESFKTTFQSCDVETRVSLIPSVSGKPGRPEIEWKIALLLELLEDAHPKIRARAAQGLVNLKDARKVAPLVKCLNDPDRDVRLKAIGSLGYSNPEPGLAVPALMAQLESADENVRREAVQALGQIGDPRALKPLLAIYNKAEKSMRSYALLAISKLKSDEAMTALVDKLNASNEDRERRQIAHRFRDRIDRSGRRGLSQAAENNVRAALKAHDARPRGKPQAQPTTDEDF